MVEIVDPGSVTLSADLSDQPCVNSMELTVGAGPAVWVGPTVGVAPEGVFVSVGVGVLVLRASELLALAEPPMRLNTNASTITVVRNMKRRFCFCMGIFLSVTFLLATANTNNTLTIYVIMPARENHVHGI